MTHKKRFRDPAQLGILEIEAADLGGQVMEWFNQKTSIGGTQIPNWGIALGAVIVLLLIYTVMQR
jgi:hypothetical protein